MTGMRMEIRPGDAASELARPLREAAWPPGTDAVVWAQTAVRRILVWDDAGELACHVGLFLRDIAWDGRTVRMGGVGGVTTRADRRRRGFATAAMQKAARELDEVDKADCALLFCQPDRFAFYRRLGWRPFQGDVFVEQPHGRVRFEMAAFVLDLRLQPRTGEIDLCGLPW